MHLMGECEQDLAGSVFGKWRNFVNTVMNLEVGQDARNFWHWCVAFVVSGVRCFSSCNAVTSSALSCSLAACPLRPDRQLNTPLSVFRSKSVRTVFP
jgi:hypothetical protein